MKELEIFEEHFVSDATKYIQMPKIRVKYIL